MISSALVGIEAEPDRRRPLRTEAMSRYWWEPQHLRKSCTALQFIALLHCRCTTAIGIKHLCKHCILLQCIALHNRKASHNTFGSIALLCNCIAQCSILSQLSTLLRRLDLQLLTCTTLCTTHIVHNIVHLRYLTYFMQSMSMSNMINRTNKITFFVGLWSCKI